jgi:hypothetical protein
VAPSSDPPDARQRSRSRKRDPVTLDLTAKEIEIPPAETAAESSLTDDPRTPADAPERETASEPSLVDDPRTPEETAHPTPSEIEAAVAQLAPEAAAGPLEGAPEEPASSSREPAPNAEVPPTQDIGEAPPPELAPGPLAGRGTGPKIAGPAEGTLESASARPAATLAEERRRRGAGLGSMLAAALIGGVVGAALTLAAERFWLKRPDPYAARLAGIEQRLAAPAAPAAPAVDLGPTERRIAALEGQLREQNQRIQSAQSAAEQAAKRADEAAARPPAEGAPSTPQPAATLDPAILEPLGARIAALETELRMRLQEVSERDAQGAEQAKQLEAVGAQVRALSQGLDNATSQATEQGQRVAAVTQQLPQLNQRVEALQKQLSERGPETTAGLRVVAADRVLDALRDGAPFPQALAALKRLNADAQQLAAMEPFAQSGAPTAAALAQEFRPLGERMIAEARGPATSWQDRLSRMAESIVTVRPIGEPASDTVSGLVARIQNALARGAFAEAAKAWDALPEPARRTAEEFGRKLKARAAAEEAARAVSNQALAALDAAAR